MAPHTGAAASPTPERPGPSHESHESHGRRLTTTPEAAARYRAAQARSGDRARLVAALRGAVRADPGFVVAAADLAALGSLPGAVGAARGEALDDILDRLPGCHGRPGQFPAALP